jgi:hypothetical protein
MALPDVPDSAALQRRETTGAIFPILDRKANEAKKNRGMGSDEENVVRESQWREAGVSPRVSKETVEDEGPSAGNPQVSKETVNEEQPIPGNPRVPKGTVGDEVPPSGSPQVSSSLSRIGCEITTWIGTVLNVFREVTNMLQTLFTPNQMDKDFTINPSIIVWSDKRSFIGQNLPDCNAGKIATSDPATHSRGF